MKLGEWLVKNEIGQAEFAKMIKVANPKVVNRYVNGERIPRLAIMARIVRQTDGEVTANDFFQ